MANEVIIEEYEGTAAKNPDGTYAQIPGKLITTQVLDIAEASAQFNAKTAFIRIQSVGTGFWYIFGGAAPSATANTDGNRWLPANQFRDLDVDVGTDLKLDTAA